MDQENEAQQYPQLTAVTSGLFQQEVMKAYIKKTDTLRELGTHKSINKLAIFLQTLSTSRADQILSQQP